MCLTPGCPEMSDGGRCKSCRARQDRSRQRTSRYYNTIDWKKKRRRILARDPICVECIVQVPCCPERSTEVDHITPRAEGGSDDDTNLQGLCHAHHSAKTMRAINA